MGKLGHRQPGICHDELSRLRVEGSIVRVGRICGGRSLFAGLCAVLAITGLTYGPSLIINPLASWKTQWYENFSGSAGSGPNLKYWKYDTGKGVFGNGEIAHDRLYGYTGVLALFL